ncbi:transposase [Streptomyces sediminimaris]|uniref:transposase n=1 Tax=Streptomyces sediminimaris TaxID=3383721 RepID=UPI003999C761
MVTTLCEAWGSDEQPVGPAGAGATAGHQTGPAAGVDATAADERRTVANPDRCPWRDAPERHGPWERVYDLFRRWQRDGTWARLVSRLHGPPRCRAGAKAVVRADHGRSAR